MCRRTMVTKTGRDTNRSAQVESEQVVDGVSTDNGNVGTAVALGQAVEESDATIAKITQHGNKVTVYCKYGNAGSEQAVPKPLHDKLSEWGYTHVGEDGGSASYTHRDEFGAHVYKK